MENKAPGSLGVYIHIPFCETKCPYCDFNTYSGIEKLIPAYIDALCEEMRRWGELVPEASANTIFFGGGTPSYLEPSDMTRLMDVLGSSFPVASNAEITLEANPGDITPQKADAWLTAGFNRVSMGVQSFDDALLKTLGRRHDSHGARTSFEALSDAGFRNRSLDLMFGLPGQSLHQWTGSLRQALDLEPDHVSLYGLQLEAGTPLEADVRLGRIDEPDDDLAAEMYLAAEEMFRVAGFRHYEISNWAQPEQESRHNLVYWENGPYLGLGPGAHSSLFGHRFANTRSPRGYMRSLGVEPTTSSDLLRLVKTPPNQSVDANSAPAILRAMVVNGPVDFIEETTLQLELAETMMMGLRLDVGVTNEQFERRFGEGLRSVFAAQIDSLKSDGLLDEDSVGIRLTQRGRLLGNEVFERFVSASESAADELA